MRILRIIPAAACLAAMGCSGETVMPPASLSGTWNFTFNTTNAEVGATCVGTMKFTISQTDQTFVGTQSGAGSVACTGIALRLAVANPSDPTEFSNEIIGTGVVGQTDVVFTLNTLKGTNTGTVTEPGKMSGRSTWTIPVSPKGSITVSGTFTGVKQ